jgi:hypothetical protein
MAPMHELKIRWAAAPGTEKMVYDTMAPIVEATYRDRGGKRPAGSPMSGRVDARLAIDASGELYLLTKSDGMIRAIVAASGF